MFVESKDEYIFDDKGLCINEFNYNNYNNSLSPFRHKKEFFYDPGNILIQILTYIWENDAWKTSDKAEYTYNSEAKLSFITGYNWDAMTNKWIISNNSEYEWDQYGNKTMEDLRSHIPDSEGSTGWWRGVSKDQDVYDEKGNRLFHRDFLWEDANQKWVESSTYQYTYDENGNLTEDLWQRYLDLTTNEYAEVFKSNFSYDAALKVSEILMPPLSYFIRPEYVESTVNKPLDYIYYAFIEDAWKAFEKGIYYYSNQEVSNVSTHLNNKGVKVYPNPAFSFIKFEIPDDLNPLLVELYDLNGKKVLSQKHLPKDQITVSQLRPGIYFYKLTGSHEIYQGKVAIK